jgi:hypothetical protein
MLHVFYSFKKKKKKETTEKQLKYVIPEKGEAQKRKNFPPSCLGLKFPEGPGPLRPQPGSPDLSLIPRSDQVLAKGYTLSTVLSHELFHANEIQEMCVVCFKGKRKRSSPFSFCESHHKSIHLFHLTGQWINGRS